MLQIAAIAFTGLVTVALPLGLMLRYRRRGGAWSAFFTGAGVFILFALVLEQGLHAAVGLSPLGGVLGNNIWLYGLYGGVAAGLFEETGRLVAFRYFLKRQTAPAAALAYGAGHGGVEAVLVVGVTMVNNLVLLGLLKSGAAADPAVLAAAEAVAATPAGMFLWAALERAAAVALHVSNSVLVFAAARQPGKRWLYPAAIGLHALANFLAATLNARVGVAAAELAAVAVAVLAACLAAGTYQNLENLPQSS